MPFTRRLFMLSAALAPFGCGSMGFLRGTAVAAPNPMPAVRQPQVGQEWSYLQRDMFNGNTLGTLTERVQSVGSQIVIARSMDTSAATSNTSTGAFGAIMKDINQINEPIGSMANEVQAGTFTALKFSSLVNYISPDANRINSIWRETCWFAPQIGRWVARESSGSYMLIGVMQSPFLENEYSWQLSSWK